MAERREGDWDCPVCGAVVFGSKESCFKCEKKAQRRDGDWDCPDCGAVVFASKDSCFKCEKKAQRREGDWDCPDCGTLVFASKTTCFKCDRDGRDAGKGAGKTKKAGKSGKAGKGSSAGQDVAAAIAPAALTPGGHLKALLRLAPKFKKSWMTYCKLYGEGFSDPSKYGDEFITEFVEYTGDLTQSKLEEDGGAEVQGDTPAVAQKRKAADLEEDDEPAPKAAKTATGDTGAGEKKKLSIRKPVADEIRRLNASGSLQKPIRVAAVAAALEPFESTAAIEILAMLNEQGPADPNAFIVEQANLAAENAA